MEWSIKHLKEMIPCTHDLGLIECPWYLLNHSYQRKYEYKNTK